MKKLTTIMLAIVVVTNLVVVVANAGQPSKTVDECKIIRNTANVIMRHRQAGTRMQDLSSVLLGDKNNKSYDFNSMMILDAYTEPFFYVEIYRKKAINDFTDKYYRDCLKHAK